MHAQRQVAIRLVGFQLLLIVVYLALLDRCLFLITKDTKSKTPALELLTVFNQTYLKKMN